MSTWGMMYCGGSKEVMSALRGISIDYNIDVHIDYRVVDLNIRVKYGSFHDHSF